MLAQPADKKRVHRVLDIASPGNAAGGYEHSHWRRRMLVEVNALDFFNPSGINDEWKNIVLMKRCGRLPGALDAEPGRHYDHVHFHMLEANGRIGMKDGEMMVWNIERILAPGGYFFFSTDHNFVSEGCRRELIGAGQGVLAALNGFIMQKLKVIYSFCDLEAVCSNLEEDFGGNLDSIKRENGRIANVFSQEANVLARKFGIGELLPERGSAGRFYSLFSNDAKIFGEHFVIAKKKDD